MAKLCQNQFNMPGLAIHFTKGGDLWGHQGVNPTHIPLCGALYLFIWRLEQSESPCKPDKNHFEIFS